MLIKQRKTLGGYFILLHPVCTCIERLSAAVDAACAVDVNKPRDTVLDVTVRDDVSELGCDVIVIDSLDDAGTADRCVPAA